jgi:hypothetical protein
MTITVNSIQDHSFSSDRSEVTIDFKAKYLDKYAIKIKLENLPDMIAALADICEKAGLPKRFQVVSPHPPERDEASPNAEDVVSKAAPGRKKILRPKSISVGADTKTNHIVLLSFDFHPPAQPVALGLPPDVATNLAEAISNFATIVRDAEKSSAATP